ncbi:hypothetical protein FOPG_18541 [Fusarium oxysporum f. sp. conglutinans race 2 54008]|uniref:Uncharacterized protein n=1 Tax=Fusarium oxysporum f. sp. conglutinans race 2 54008 TaxID=1089457 RepID=X0GZB8_FUSOX|nr:hypothetical protein FOPG_18541 [Fusarium oxysporum f. sp. conglutinans race 2 54008]
MPYCSACFRANYPYSITSQAYMSIFEGSSSSSIFY